jgi:hypothetical protein
MIASLSAGVGASNSAGFATILSRSLRPLPLCQCWAVKCTAQIVCRQAHCHPYYHSQPSMHLGLLPRIICQQAPEPP